MTTPAPTEPRFYFAVTRLHTALRALNLPATGEDRDAIVITDAAIWDATQRWSGDLPAEATPDGLFSPAPNIFVPYHNLLPGAVRLLLGAGMEQNLAIVPDMQARDMPIPPNPVETLEAGFDVIGMSEATERALRGALDDLVTTANLLVGPAGEARAIERMLDAAGVGPHGPAPVHTPLRERVKLLVEDWQERQAERATTWAVPEVEAIKRTLDASAIPGETLAARVQWLLTHTTTPT